MAKRAKKEKKVKDLDAQISLENENNLTNENEIELNASSELENSSLESSVELNTSEHKNSHESSVSPSWMSHIENAADALSDFDEAATTETEIFETEGQEEHPLLKETSLDEEEMSADVEDEIEDSELAGFESAEIAEVEFVEEERVVSIIESILFASDRPVSLMSIREVFKGTNVRKDKIKRILDQLAVEYAGAQRGVTLEEITGGYQLRTKIDNMNFLRRSIKAKTFKLSGPALETLAIVAYKQPTVKNEIDQIRGVESGHLLRALMEKGLVHFEGKAENLPGRPMQYGTTRKFLEIFGLRNLKELPTLSQIDELLPEGIGEEEEQKPTLATVTDSLSQEVKEISYSQGEEELGNIEAELETISTSSDFFEQEKIRQKQKRDAEKAQDIRDAMTMGEEVSKRDINWLKKYEEGLALAEQGMQVPQNFVEDGATEAQLDQAEQTVDQVTDSEITEELSFVEDSQSEIESEELEDEEDSHIEDEIPFYGEADEIK